MPIPEMKRDAGFRMTSNLEFLRKVFRKYVVLGRPKKYLYIYVFWENIFPFRGIPADNISSQQIINVYIQQVTQAASFLRRLV